MLYFKQDDFPDIAPKQLKTVSTPTCSIVDSRLVKELSLFGGISYIDDARNNTGADLSNDRLEALIKDTDEIGLFHKWNYKLLREVGLKGSTTIAVTAVTDTGTVPNQIRADFHISEWWTAVETMAKWPRLKSSCRKALQMNDVSPLHVKMLANISQVRLGVIKWFGANIWFGTSCIHRYIWYVLPMKRRIVSIQSKPIAVILIRRDYE